MTEEEKVENEKKPSGEKEDDEDKKPVMVDMTGKKGKPKSFIVGI